MDSFRGDFDTIASLIQRSWAENPKPPFLYTPEVLSSFFTYPGVDLALSPALIGGSDPIAFIAGFPRRVRFRGRELRIIVSAFLSVEPGKKKLGYGILAWNELVRRARAADYDGLMSYCVEGDAMDRMILGGFLRLGIPAERVLSIPYLMHLVWPRGPVPGETPSEEGFIDTFRELAASVLDLTPLARVWSPPEAAWQCFLRKDALRVLVSRGARRGILTGYLMQIADPGRTRCLLIEDVLWGNLEREERATLVRNMLDKGAASGARIVTVPVLNYSDMEPFLMAGFRRATRTLNAYLSVWTGQPSPGALPSMYLDVF